MSTAPPLPLTKADFQSDQETRWCPGCGDYSVLAAIQGFMPELGIPPEKIVFITGLCELAGSVALVTKPLRWWAGVAFAAYALCVWPANFKHAIDGIDLPYVTNSWLYHGPRLAFQPVIIWWALYCSKAIDWPWRR